MEPRRLTAGLLLALAAGCGGERTGGVELRIQAPPGGAPPAALALDWFDEGGERFRDRSVPAGAPDGAGVVARVRVQTIGAGRRWAVLRGLDEAGAVASEGAAVAETTAGQWRVVEVALTAGRLPDRDGDGLPDAVDDCPADPRAHGGCTSSPDGGTPDRPPAPDAGADAAGPDVAADGPAGPDAPPADAAAPADAPVDGPPAPADAAAPDVAPDAPACSLLLATGATPENGDLAARDRLIRLGCEVTPVAEEMLTAAHLAGRSLVVVGASAGSSPRYAMLLRDSTVPLLVMERRALRDLRMSGTVENTDWGELGMQTALTIVTPSSPLAAGLTGTVTVLGGGAQEIGWAVPAAGATKVAHIASMATRVTIFSIEKGAALTTGTAPARRVAFLIENSFSGATADGAKLFDAAARWALGR